MNWPEAHRFWRSKVNLQDHNYLLTKWSESESGQTIAHPLSIQYRLSFRQTTFMSLSPRKWTVKQVCHEKCFLSELNCRFYIILRDTHGNGVWLFSLAVFGWFDWTAVNRRLHPGSPPAQWCSCWLDTPPQIASSCFSLPRSSLLRPHSPCLRRSSSCHHDAPRGNVAQQAGTCRLGSKT